MTPGVSLKPGTPIEDVFPLVSYSFLLGIVLWNRFNIVWFLSFQCPCCFDTSFSKENTKGMLVYSPGLKNTMDKIFFFLHYIFFHPFYRICCQNGTSENACEWKSNTFLQRPSLYDLFLVRALQLEDENPVELVLVMTVEPGFGGQKFMPEMMDKVHNCCFSAFNWLWLFVFISTRSWFIHGITGTYTAEEVSISRHRGEFWSYWQLDFVSFLVSVLDIVSYEFTQPQRNW